MLDSIRLLVILLRSQVRCMRRCLPITLQPSILWIHQRRSIHQLYIRMSSLQKHWGDCCEGWCLLMQLYKMWITSSLPRWRMCGSASYRSNQLVFDHQMFSRSSLLKWKMYFRSQAMYSTLPPRLHMRKWPMRSKDCSRPMRLDPMQTRICLQGWSMHSRSWLGMCCNPLHVRLSMHQWRMCSCCCWSLLECHMPGRNYLQIWSLCEGHCYDRSLFSYQMLGRVWM